MTGEILYFPLDTSTRSGLESNTRYLEQPPKQSAIATGNHQKQNTSKDRIWNVAVVRLDDRKNSLYKDAPDYTDIYKAATTWHPDNRPIDLLYPDIVQYRNEDSYKNKS